MRRKLLLVQAYFIEGVVRSKRKGFSSKDARTESCKDTLKITITGSYDLFV